MSVEMSGWDTLDRALADAERALKNERELADMMAEACAPAVKAIASIIGTGRPWRETGLTAKDISVALDKESRVGGAVSVAIGASPKRAFIVRMLERGTSYSPAFPALRPGWDVAEGQVKAAITSGLRRLLPTLAKG